MQQLITHLEKLPVSLQRLRQAAPNHCKVMLYDKLPNTLSAMFGDKSCVVVLYQLHSAKGRALDKTGHFCLVFKTAKGHPKRLPGAIQRPQGFPREIKTPKFPTIPTFTMCLQSGPTVPIDSPLRPENTFFAGEVRFLAPVHTDPTRFPS